MLTFLNEVHFWTLRDDINVPDTDFGAFRYYDKKSAGDSSFSEGKRLYAEKRDIQWILTNKRPHKLKDSLRELEECLSQQRIVLSQWRDSALLQIVFSSGLLANILVNMYTGDVLNIIFDKFLVGKLLSDYIVGAVLTKSHLVCAYNDNQLTLVYFTKPALKRTTPKLLNRLDPRIQTLELAGPPGRRMERKISCNVSGDMILVWWHSCQDEVFPWSPHFKEEDRANILVYGISGVKSELLCHHKSEHDPLRVAFSDIHSNILHCVEQKVSRKGEVTVENAIYEIGRSGLHRLSLSSIPLPTHVCCHGFDPGQEKLLIGCVDGSLVLFDKGRGITHTVKAAFIPSVVSWHPEGALVFVANERAQLQVLDATLSCIRQQFLGEDAAPGNILDLAVYLRGQPTLHNLLWASKSDAMIVHVHKYAPVDSLLLLVFERGPLATLRLVGGGGILGDIHGGAGLSLDSLLAQYLWVNQVDRAINLLQACSWDIHGSACLSALYRITNYLFKRPLTPEREDQLQNALGTFHLPVRPMSSTTIEEFAAPVRDLTRRFFHHLLRYHLFEKAFRLAIDLQCRDLFLDIHFAARQAGQMDLATAAYSKAEDLDGFRGTDDTASSHSVCSRSSCSVCTSDETPLSGSGSVSGSSCTENGHDVKQSDALLSRRGSRRSSLRQRHRPLGRSSSHVNSTRSSTRSRRSEALSETVHPHENAVQTAAILGKLSLPAALPPDGSASLTNVETDIPVESSTPLNNQCNFQHDGTATSGLPHTDMPDDVAYKDSGHFPFSDDRVEYTVTSSSHTGGLTVCDYPTTSNQQHQHIRQLLLNHLNSYQESPPSIVPSGPLSSSTPTASRSGAGVTNSSSQQPSRVHEKLKVKFSDTVTQISVPDRLDTVLEETEDQLPYRSLPDSLNSYYGSLKTSGGSSTRTCYSLQSFPSQYDRVVTAPEVASLGDLPSDSACIPNLVANAALVNWQTKDSWRPPTFASSSPECGRKTNESSTSPTMTTSSSPSIRKADESFSSTTHDGIYCSTSFRKTDEFCLSPTVATYSIPSRQTDEVRLPSTGDSYSSVFSRKSDEPCLTQTVSTYSSVSFRKTDESSHSSRVVSYPSIQDRKTGKALLSSKVAACSPISTGAKDEACVMPTFANYSTVRSREADRPVVSPMVTACSSAPSHAQETDEQSLSSSITSCPTLQWIITDCDRSRSSSALDNVNKLPLTQTTIIPAQSNTVYASSNSQPAFANVWTGRYDNQAQGALFDSNRHYTFHPGHDSENKSYPFDEVAIHDRLTRQSSLKSVSKSVLGQPSDWPRSAAQLETESVSNTYVPNSSNVWSTSVNGTSSEILREESWSVDMPNDLLESNANIELDLSSLLPGSRKSVAPSLTSSNRLAASVPLKPPVTRSQSDPNYVLKYVNIPDLSEEEENNGSIKVVHFGVV